MGITPKWQFLNELLPASASSCNYQGFSLTEIYSRHFVQEAPILFGHLDFFRTLIHTFYFFHHSWKLSSSQIQNGHSFQHFSYPFLELVAGAIIAVWWSFDFWWSSMLRFLKFELPLVKAFFLPLSICTIFTSCNFFFAVRIILKPEVVLLPFWMVSAA